MSWKDKNTQRKRWVVGIVITGCLLLVWWATVGPATLFRIQIWLLKHGAWHNIDHWVVHGNWYLPYLVEETDNLTPAPGSVRRAPSYSEAFEAYAYYRVDTVSDWVRLALHEMTRLSDGVGLNHLDGTTDDQRMEAARFWREWYAKHRDRLRWNARACVFEILPADTPQ